MADRIEVYQTASGEYAWHVKAGNNEIISSGESHPHLSAAKRAARRAHPGVPLVVKTDDLYDPSDDAPEPEPDE